MPTHPPRLLAVAPPLVAGVCARAGVGGVLSEAEVEVYDRLTVERRRQDWLAGRVAAKRVLRAALRHGGERVPAYPAITVLNDSVGAPRFAIVGRPDIEDRWNISIAHDDGFAVAALACTARSGRVGVDIERNRPLSPALLRHVLTPREQRRVDEPPGSLAPPSPLAVWTLKEAVVKAACAHGAPTMREVELERRGPARYAAHLVRDGAPHLRIRAVWRARGTHVIAVATCRRLDAA